MARQILWGTTPFLLNQSYFEQGYQRGRRYFFEDCSEQQQAPSPITVTELLHLVARPDEQGHYQLDDGMDTTDFREGVEELIGVLVGYLGGPLYEETEEEFQRRQAEELVLPENIKEQQERMKHVVFPNAAWISGRAL